MAESHLQSMESQRLRRAMRDLVAISTLPAIWAGADARRIPKSLADVLCTTLDLDVAYVCIIEPPPVSEALRTSTPGTADREELLALMREVARAEASRDVTEPGTRRKLQCAVSRFGMGDVRGVLVAATARANFPAEEDRVLLGVAANHACAELYRRTAERDIRAKTERLELLARDQEMLLGQVQAERARLEEVFEHSQSFMAVLSGPDHVFERANRKYVELIGGRDLLGKPLAEALPETVQQGFVDLLHNVFISGRTYTGADVPVVLRHPDGTSRTAYVDFVYQAIRGGNGEITGVFVQGIDLTERKRSETARKAAQAELELLLARETRRANVLGLVADAGRKLNSVRDTEAVAAILTEEARQIIGSHQAVTSLTVSDDWAQAINAVSLSDKYSEYRGYAERPDGSGIYSLVCRTNRPMRMTQEQLEAHPAWRAFGKHSGRHPPMRGWLAVPLIGHGGRNLGLVQLSDKYTGEFTEEDEAVLAQLAAIASAGIENARFYKELQQQDRRKDEFLATLAHELRNPLAPVRSGLALLERASSLEGTEQVRTMMSRQVAHMVRLIDDLLDVSRITTGKVQLRPEVVEVRTVLDAAIEVSRPVIERARHELLVSLPEAPLYVRADPTRMAQVVGNLLNNAAKYTQEGGRIELAAHQDGIQVVIRVRDNGTGLEPRTIPEIFELFTQVGKTLPQAQGGLGIGLALVKKLVEMHGGTVEAQSAGLGYGSTFTLRLPA
ncbi:MAG TPA: ATP-binding protein, partial [Ramlibacter sp.]|nr:ATP-binding protein [Ramlibacter sp.]